MSTSYSSGSESLEVDSAIGDRDSAIGGESASRTTSLTPSILDYRYENGRRYHAYMDGTYHLPNDDIEADRLDLQHHLFRLTTGGPLFLAPIDKTSIHNVLDVGCGTGIWSMDFADEFPNANVLGIDLSPIQPTEIPPNCSFLVDNAEAEWAHDRTFDLIHSRAMCAGIKNWPKYIRQAYENLTPGGWLELQEVSVPPRCDDGSAPADSSIMYCSNTLAKAAAVAGLNMKAPAQFKDWLKEAGFVDIHIKRYKWPIGPWAKGSKEKTLGRWALQDCLDALQGGTLGLFTRVLGWSVEEVETLLSEVRKEMKGEKSHCYMPV
ncbi:S-adenosyl-L-methionine-dependent methyltransferase [Saccharata proteae CBS 121410]|uniref:S-adenosyl-L-methionine-dependent methyltransferase n=1 Tax=Saccharata proteae CBS 121410 TaxID=1314787 RepID=A0A9P4HRJ9_9PEZI|nr:S-adenosyl-L-methionine-dependent methyltransferase [Saccharata proteae CBS 121410]